MKKVVIAGASVYGLKNMSDDSMFSVFCRELHSLVPDIEITLLARHPGKELDAQYGVRSIKNLDFDSKAESMGHWFRGLNPGDPTHHLRAIWDAIGEAEMLILGGDPFIDITIGFYRGLAPYAALLVTLAKFLGKPVVLHGIHLGRPLTTDFGKELARFCISNAKLATIREERSRELFADIGVTGDNIVATADTAFGLDPIKGKEQGLKVLKKEGIQFNSDKVIGVTFRHMYWKWNVDQWGHYSQIMADLCDYMIAEFGADVLFIPHCFYNIDHHYEDDRPAAKDIVDKMVHKDYAHRITRDYTLPDVLALFPLLDMIFGNRRHSVIFGAVHDVAGMGVGEVGHVQPVMEELQIGGELFVDIDDFELETLKRNVTYVWTHKEELKSKMRQALPSLREKAVINAKLVADLLH